MSTIVWDGTTLAADKQATNANTRRTTSKIWKHGDKLMAAHGDLICAEALRNWVVNNDMHPAKYPQLERDDVVGFWVITRDGMLAFEGSKPYPLKFEDPFIADGSGRDFAMGAMEMGANAIRAVEVAAKFDIYTGREVEWFRLDDD